MMRASFTITVRRGSGDLITYDADCLTLGHRNVESGAISTLSFRCSGEVETVDAENVAAVIFHSAGAAHCSFCDETLGPRIGHGIHAGG